MNRNGDLVIIYKASCTHKPTESFWKLSEKKKGNWCLCPTSDLPDDLISPEQQKKNKVKVWCLVCKVLELIFPATKHVIKILIWTWCLPNVICSQHPVRVTFRCLGLTHGLHVSSLPSSRVLFPSICTVQFSKSAEILVHSQWSLELIELMSLQRIEIVSGLDLLAKSMFMFFCSLMHLASWTAVMLTIHPTVFTSASLKYSGQWHSTPTAKAAKD